MPLSLAVISYDISDFAGTDFDARRTKVYATNNVIGGAVIDTDGNKIYLGSGNATIAADGTGSISVPIPGAGSNPASWQTTIHVDYPDRNNPRGRTTRSFGPFTITASANLADLVPQQEVPAEYVTQVTAQLDAKVTQAQTARAGAEAARDAATTITGLTGEDAAIANRINTPGSQTDTALKATLGVAKFKVNDAGLFVSKDGSDTNDGLSPGRAKATVAAAHAALPSGKGKINVGAGVHAVNGLALTNGTLIEGYGAGTGATTLTSAGNVLTVPTGLVQDVVIRNLSITSTGGSCFAIAGMLGLSTIEDVYLAQVGGAAPAIDAAGLIDTKWRIHAESVNGTAVPLIRLRAAVNNVDAIACNSFTGRATHTTGYVFLIEDATGGSYVENNRIFDFNFEQTSLGAAKILSGTGNVLDNCIALDFIASITAPLVYIGKSAASTKISDRNRISFQRHGGLLGTGGKDVELQAGGVTGTTLLDCWADTGGGITVDYGNTQAAVVNTDLLASTNHKQVTGPAVYGHKFMHENPDNIIGAAAAGAGMSMVEPSTHKLWISDGTVWRDAMGTARA